MTASSRYRGQPVSEGIGTGGIYLGDAPEEADRGQPDPGEDDVRAAFAAVARERAALAGRQRERGEDLEEGKVDKRATSFTKRPATSGPDSFLVCAVATNGPMSLRASSELPAP